MQQHLIKTILILAAIFTWESVYSKDFNIYLDADGSSSKESSDALYKALDFSVKKYSKKFKDHNFQVIRLDHRANTRRSLANYKKIIKDPNFLFVLGGIHSPPLITNKNYINENKVLTFVPWAAGGPITRANSSANWIFRLSIDDTKVGEFISEEALKKKCKRPYLLTEKTPWGRFNRKNMIQVLEDKKTPIAGSFEFGWGVSSLGAIEITKKVKSSKASCLFFVGASKDARTLFSALGKQMPGLAVYSHWGITGSESLQMAEIIEKSGLIVKVVQTKFSFMDTEISHKQRKVMAEIFAYTGYVSVEQIKPMTAWVHTIDLVNVVFHALESVDLNQIEKSLVRVDLKRKLEKGFDKPILGLIKNYSGYQVYTKERPDAHEALGKEDFRLRRFLPSGALR